MILDLAIVLLLLISLLIGWKIGFFRYVLKIASIFTGLILSLLLTSPLAQLLMITPFGTGFELNIYNNILENTGSSVDLTSIAGLKNLLSSIGIPSFLHGSIIDLLGNFVEPDQIIHSLANIITMMIMHVIAFIIILIGSTLIIMFMKLIVNLIRENKIVVKIDSFVGMFFSLGVFSLLIFTTIAITVGLLNINFIEDSIGPFFNEQLNQSIGIFKYFYNENIIINFFKIIF